MEVWNLICHCECSEAECGNLDILLNLTGTNEIASSCLLANAFVFGHFSKKPCHCECSEAECGNLDIIFNRLNERGLVNNWKY